jgi:hypothetical protein
MPFKLKLSLGLSKPTTYETVWQNFSEQLLSLSLTSNSDLLVPCQERTTNKRFGKQNSLPKIGLAFKDTNGNEPLPFGYDRGRCGASKSKPQVMKICSEIYQ